MGGLPAYSAGCPLVICAACSNDERTAGEKAGSPPNSPTPYRRPTDTGLPWYCTTRAVLAAGRRRPLAFAYEHNLKLRAVARR
ncbi:MAG: hypothetical protein WKG07_26860 [Hymenobacter sp.]